MADQSIYKVRLSAETAAIVEADAANKKMSPEAIIAFLVARYASVQGEKPIVLEDADRREIERIARKNVGSAREVVAILKQAASIECAGVSVEIAPNALARMKRVAPPKKPFAEWMGGALSRLISNAEEF